MSGHTPGPWTPHYGGKYVVPAEHANRPIGGSVYEQQDRDNYAQVIATLREDKYGRGSRHANACLIAAAPELLETAKWLMAHMPWPGSDALATKDNAIVALGKAIAKAEALDEDGES